MNARKKGVIISYAYTIIHMVVNIAYVPVLLSYLGTDEYGLYQLVASLFSYIVVFESSVSGSITKFYCEAVALEDKVKKENVLAIARRIYNVISIVILFAGIGAMYIFRNVYSNTFTEAQLNESVWMLLVLVLNYIVTLKNLPYVASINAHERFFFLKMVAIIVQLLQPLVSILILNKNPYALTVVLVQFIINVCMAIVRWGYAKFQLRIKVIFHYWDKELANGILHLTLALLLSNIADQIFWKTDQLILGKMIGTVAVTLYSIAAQIYMNYMNVGLTVSSVFLPKLTKLYTEGKYKEISDLFISVGRISFQLLFLVLSGFFIFGQEFIRLWVGSEQQEAYWVALIIMVPFTIDIAQNLGLSILKVMNRYSFRANMYLIGALVNIISTVFMVRLWDILGAAISTALTMFITSGVILNIYYYKRIGLDIKGFWKNICEIVLKILPVVLVGYLVNNQLIDFKDSFIMLTVKILLYVCVYAIVSRKFIFNDSEISYLNSIMNKITKNK